ncbi:MAG: hypothetical protein H6658_00390 [Ardenticatenaceae bacterium]|nr:hypothetical protein [Ardenticatenaceae bacterium]
MQHIKKHIGALFFSSFILLILLVGLAMNQYEVRSLTPEDSLIPLDTSFTYQGFLEDDGSPVDGDCDFQFDLYETATGGTTVGNPHHVTLPVDRGVFADKLDFGDVAYNSVRFWVSVAVRCPSGSGSFTTLSPRTEIVAAPLANTMPNARVNATNGEVEIKTLKVWQNASVHGDLSIRGSVTNRVVLEGSGSSGRVSVYDNNSEIVMLHLSGGGGRVSVYDGFFGEERAYMSAFSDGVGYMETEGPGGSNNVTLSALNGYLDNGYISVSNSSGSDRAVMYVNSSDRGWISVDDDIGNERAYLTAGSNGAGYMETEGDNGNNNFVVSNLSGYPNNGAAVVVDAGGTNQAGMYVNSAGQGVVFGDIVGFQMENPSKADTEIWYTSLQGSEAATYIRGTAQLVNGQATITFPDHFLAVASEQGMTIQLTPLSADSLGLAVIEKSLAGVQVQELYKGSGTYEFDFTVTAVRQGYENYEVIRPALATQPAEFSLDEGAGKISQEEND